MSNEVITLVKDTSLARVIIVAEIFYVNETFILSKSIVWPLFYIGVFFLVFVGALTLLFRFLEKKLSYYLWIIYPPYKIRIFIFIKICHNTTALIL